MSFASYNLRVKYTQKIIDQYIDAPVIRGERDPITLIDTLRSYLGYDPLFTTRQSNVVEYLDSQLEPIGRLSAIVGDIAAINQNDKWALGVVLSHEHSLFVIEGNVFGLVPNKQVMKTWSNKGEVPCS
jgi:hypothetical protein